MLFMDNLITYAAGEHLSKKHQCYTRIATLLSTYKAKSTSNECGLACLQTSREPKFCCYSDSCGYLSTGDDLANF